MRVRAAVLEEFGAPLSVQEIEPDLDEGELELGMFSGLVQYGWIFGHSARVHPDPAERAWAEAELAWWVPRVRRAIESSSPGIG